MQQPQPNTDIHVIQAQTKPKKTTAEWIILLCLCVSFLFIGTFRAFENGNGSAMVSAGEQASTAFWFNAFFYALIAWVVFELLMRAYYFFVSMSMYVFVVPKRGAYYILRMFYAVRNVVVGGLYFLLFVSPIWINFVPFFVMIVDYVALMATFFLIRKQYLGTLLAPFAWRSFLKPFLVYEIIAIALSIGGVL